VVPELIKIMTMAAREIATSLCFLPGLRMLIAIEADQLVWVRIHELTDPTLRKRLGQKTTMRMMTQMIRAQGNLRTGKTP
jgi:hypothetical protein